MVGESRFDGFEWDDEKSILTAKVRGIDFIAAAKIFDGFFVEREMDSAGTQSTNHRRLAGIKSRKENVS